MTRFRLATRETFSSLAIRNFRLFFVGQGISQVGNWLTLVAQSLLVLSITRSGVALGLLTAFQFGPVLLLGAWAGLVADRSDKRKLLMIVQVGAMVQSFVLAALAFMDEPPLVAIYAVAALGGLAMAFDNPARRAFVVEMVPEEAVPNAVGLNSAVMTSSRIVGPALAGLLTVTVGFGWAFVVDGLSYVAVLVALAMMRTTELRPSAVAERAKGQVREGLHYVRRAPDLFIPLVMMGVIGALAFNFQVVLPLFVTDTFDGAPSTFTLLLSAMSAGSLVGALVGARRTQVETPHVVVSAAFFGLAMLALALSPVLWIAFPLGFLVGVASITFLTTSTAIVQMKSDPSMRGRVLALQAILFLGSTPVGGPILGVVCDVLGARAGLALGGFAALGAAAWGRAAHQRAAAGADDADLLVAPGTQPA
ncbi:MAG: MFS transporter [Acidimicrobiales bacterium]|nr:MFS transporter [Acidimicrobiales bacterium]